VTGRRAALRVARRTAWRNRKRTVFLIALIGVPIAASVVVAGLVRAAEMTPEEQARATFGDADYLVYATYLPEVEEWVEGKLAGVDGVESMLYHEAYGRLGSGEYGRILDVDPDDALGGSVMTVIEGEPPDEPDEIAVSRALAGAYDVEVGDTVDMAILVDEPSEYEIVGIVSPPLIQNEAIALVTPETMTTLVEESGNVEQANVSSLWLATGPEADQTAVELAESWMEEQTAFWPSSAVVPKPEALANLPDDIYIQLDQAQVDEMLAMEFTGEEGLPPEEEMYQAAYELIGEDGWEPMVIPYVSTELRSTYVEGAYQDLASSPPIVSTGVAALLLAEVAFIAGAAFATGTRRRLREIGLLGANGADIKQIRLTVIGEGLTVGVVGGLAGVAAGVVVLIVGRPIIQRFVSVLITGVELYPWDVVGPLLVAILATVIAAWLPARTASKVPTTTALQGRMPARAPRPWVAPLGLGLAGFGGLLLLVALTAAGTTATSAVAAIGSLLMVGGVALLAGPIVALVARMADRLRSTPRLVLRDSGRHRTRASVAVAATMVILLAPALTFALQTTEAERSLLYGLPTPADQVILAGSYDELGNPSTITAADIANVAGLVPEDGVARMTRLNVATVLEGESVPPPGQEEFAEAEGGEIVLGTPEWGAMLATPDLVDLYGGAAIESALDETGVVIFGVEDRDSWVLIDGERYDARELPVAVMWGVPRVLVSDDVAAGLGDPERLEGAIFHLSREMTNDERQELYYGNLEIYGGWSDISTTEVYLIGAGATLLAVLIVVALVTAVAAAEIKEEMEVIVAVGAPGSIRRRFLGVQTWLYTAIAALLAVPLGIGAIKIFGVAQGGYYGGPFGMLPSSHVVIPWPGIGFLILVLPVVVGLLTAAVTRSAPVTPPRRAT
jgi:ABC-type lipoprotein release transport system permease subunit